MRKKHSDNNSPWNEEELEVLKGLTNPAAIQAFLDNIPYSADPFYRSPRSVLRDRKAHCVDGAIFAAAALRRIGECPVIMEMKAVRDDDHVISIFRREGRVGAVAKSNVVGLRFREPVYKSVRELIMSYFESYYNIESEKTLREYSAILDMRQFDDIHWMTQDEGIEHIVTRLEHSRHYPVLTQSMISSLTLIDPRSYTAGLLGSDEAGLYDPKKGER